MSQEKLADANRTAFTTVVFSDNELLVSCSDARSVVERLTGRRLRVGTLHRGALHGLHGVKLKWISTSGRECTSAQWILEFFNNMTVARNGDTSLVAPQRASEQKRQEQAARILADAGILK